MGINKSIITFITRLAILLAVALLLFNFFYFGKITLVGKTTTTCEAVAGNTVLQQSQSAKLRPGSYTVRLRGKHIGLVSSKVVVFPFSHKTVSCPEKNLSDEQIVQGLDPTFAKLKLVEIHYFENDTWLVAYIGEKGFSEGTRQIVASYSNAGWTLTTPDNRGTYSAIPTSVQKYIDEASGNE